MKKAFLFVWLVIILSSCSLQEKSVDGAVNTEPILKEPPELTVFSNNNKVVAVLGAYSWSYDNGDETSTSISVDVDAPPRIVYQQPTPLNTNLGSDVDLEFALDPEEVQVNIWNNSQIVREVEVKDTSFKTDEIGYILYEIYATWEQDSASYAIKLNIE